MQKKIKNFVIKIFFDVSMYFKCYMIVEYYLTAYPAVYGQFPQAIPQQIAAVPAQREGKSSPSF